MTCPRRSPRGHGAAPERASRRRRITARSLAIVTAPVNLMAIPQRADERPGVRDAGMRQHPRAGRATDV